MNNYLNTLNESQQKSVLHFNGPLMVIAGAGSGKTRVLTYRIVHLIKAHHIDPFNILSLTFTNKAAQEMKSRIGRIIGESEAKNLWMGTFHSIFSKILHIEAHKLGYPPNFSIYDAQDSQRVIGLIVKQLNLDKEYYKAKTISSRISSLKNNLITVNVYSNNSELIEQDKFTKRPHFGLIYKTYVETCFKNGAMDFDDLLLKTNELLTKFPEVLLKYQKQFKYILVDEYQDTNHSQYIIIKMLSDRYQNICIVGDDSQSIYAFRGANIRNIFNFQKDYSDTKTFRLEQNYRSTKTIVEAANSVIEKNKNKLEKTIWTDNEKGDLIHVQRCYNDSEEGRFVASSIFENAISNQTSYNNFVILYRTNSQSRPLEEALRKREIPYKIVGSVSFYQRKEIKDVLAYFKLLVNPKDDECFLRIVNFPARGIGQTTINKLIIGAKEAKQPLLVFLSNSALKNLSIASGTLEKLQDFHLLFTSLKIANQTLNANLLADEIIKKSYLLNEYRKDISIEGSARIENIESLLNGIAEFTKRQLNESLSAKLADYLMEVALITDLDKFTPDEESVTLMTIHLAKGLEFPNVYIVGIEENLFPSALSSSHEDIEEERRLFYVALTRAEKRAYLSYAENRFKWGHFNSCEPSRFLAEINPKYLSFSPLSKSTVKHDNFVTRSTNFTPEKRPNKVPKVINHIQLKKLKEINSLNFPTQNFKQNASIQIGNIISHHQFGKGVVTNFENGGNDKKVIVKFDNGSEKKLLLRFAKLNIIP